MKQYMRDFFVSLFFGCFFFVLFFLLLLLLICCWFVVFYFVVVVVVLWLFCCGVFGFFRIFLFCFDFLTSALVEVVDCITNWARCNWFVR